MGNLVNKLLCVPEAEGSEKNMAFVFVKPHAVTEAAKKVVADGLAAKGVQIIQQGGLTAEVSDDQSPLQSPAPQAPMAAQAMATLSSSQSAPVCACCPKAPCTPSAGRSSLPAA